MSGQATPSSVLVQAEAVVSRTPPWLQRWEQRLERWGDQLNPILVKESRQALKSRQFVVTFTLLLICGWVWSVCGLVLRIPEVYYAPSGIYMLSGYYLILAIPMVTIVPFSAYRSLAAERDDGTYELLSVSSLSSRQIVTGKLGSAVLQMLVYYSALAPCIAFTYLLRGVDILTVFLLLSYTFCGSVLLSSMAIVCAGAARSRNVQSAISVLLMLALVISGISWGSFITAILSQGVGSIPFDSSDFWISHGALLVLWATYVALMVQIAAAQNSFASDNRSTRVRVVLFVQTAIFVGWVAYGWARIGQNEFLIAMLCAAGVHWYLYGMFLSGESAILSPRVRRSLPESFMGRVFLTWFNPGSGTGYLFAVAHVIGLCLLVIVAIIVQQDFSVPVSRLAANRTPERYIAFAYMAGLYYIAYLGFPRLLYLMIPNRHQYGFIVPIVLNLLILVVGSVVPFIAHTFNDRFRTVYYSEWQFTNWAWTFTEILDRGNVNEVVVMLVGLSAGVILILNLFATGREIEAVRISVPKRVQSEQEHAFQPQALSEAASRVNANLSDSSSE